MLDCAEIADLKMLRDEIKPANSSDDMRTTRTDLDRQRQFEVLEKIIQHAEVSKSTACTQS